MQKIARKMKKFSRPVQEHYKANKISDHVKSSEKFLHENRSCGIEYPFPEVRRHQKCSENRKKYFSLKLSTTISARKCPFVFSHLLLSTRKNLGTFPNFRHGSLLMQACERSCRQYYNLDICACAEPNVPSPPGSTLCTEEKGKKS